MNRYQNNFCREKILGYYLPSQGDKPEDAFNRAKKEALCAFKSSICLLDEYKFYDFVKNKPEEAKWTKNNLNMC